jgi:mono/diheme cytochrome c family protein
MGSFRSGFGLVAGVLAVAGFVLVPQVLAQSGDPAAGKTVYTNAGCGTCHTFGPANSTGTIGPNLNTSNSTHAQVVRVVTNGSSSAAGAMPAFRGTLTPTQIQDVAAFVAGTGGGQTPTQTTPTQTTPSQTTPTQTTPAQTTPTQTTPTQTTPAQTTPAQTTPAETAPAETTPAPVSPPPPPASNGGQGQAPSGALPSTGFDPLPFAILAAGLCALGLALVFWHPRRRGGGQ